MSFGQSLDAAGHTQHRPYPAAWMASAESAESATQFYAVLQRSLWGFEVIEICKVSGWEISPWMWNGKMWKDIARLCHISEHARSNHCNPINTLQKGFPRHWPQAKGLGAVDSPAGSCRWARYLPEKMPIFFKEKAAIITIRLVAIMWYYPLLPTTNTRLFLFTTVFLAAHGWSNAADLGWPPRSNSWDGIMG